MMFIILYYFVNYIFNSNAILWMLIFIYIILYISWLCFGDTCRLSFLRDYDYALRDSSGVDCVSGILAARYNVSRGFLQAGGRLSRICALVFYEEVDEIFDLDSESCKLCYIP